MIYGFNYYKEKALLFSSNLKNFAEILLGEGCSAIEIPYDDEIIKEIKKAKSIINKFKFISIHSPGDKKLQEFIPSLKEIQKFIKINSIVLHPDKIQNFNNLNQIPFSLENLDYRHKEYTTLKEIYDLSEKLRTKIVIDTSHLYSVEPNIKLWGISSKIINKVSHFHISGIKKGKIHNPLNNQSKNIVKLITSFNKPIIIEGLSENLEGLRRSIKLLN